MVGFFSVCFLVFFGLDLNSFLMVLAALFGSPVAWCFECLGLPAPGGLGKRERRWPHRRRRELQVSWAERRAELRLGRFGQGLKGD